MSAFTDLQFRLSGGSGNTAAASSLGGAMSTAGGGNILSNTVDDTTPFAGITIIDAPGCTAGTGTLYFALSGTLLSWEESGGTLGTAVNVNTNGDYTIYSGNKVGALRITKSGSLPVADTSLPVLVSRNLQNLFPSLSATDTISGTTTYRCLYIYNASASAISNIRLFVDDVPSGSTIAMGFDPAAIGTAGSNPAGSIVVETDIPTGVTFSAPTTPATGLLIGSLASVSYKALWIRRTVLANSGYSGSELFRLGVSFA